MKGSRIIGFFLMWKNKVVVADSNQSSFFFFLREIKELSPQIPAFSGYKAHYVTSFTSVDLRQIL